LNSSTIWDGRLATDGESEPALALRRREVSILSPLRYPGAKRRLAGYIAETLRLNALRPRLFVEPFAGGASVALQLLNDDVVDQVALGEKDPLVASFWKIVFNDPDWLVDQIARIPVTLEQWDHFRHAQLVTDRDRALACLFLNRTSFSGILARRAGPLGGRAQTSENTISCRFPVPTLVKRIQQAAALRDRVLFVEDTNWRETIRRVEVLRLSQGQVFYYLDPPFYFKADRLYSCYFRHDDHVALRDVIVELEQPWLLSYDPAPPVVALYAENGHGASQLDLIYSAAASGALVRAQELIITNLPHLPAESRLWRSSVEWRKVATPEWRASSEAAD
jgi:DNA adenine methylase